MYPYFQKIIWSSFVQFLSSSMTKSVRQYMINFIIHCKYLPNFQIILTIKRSMGKMNMSLCYNCLNSTLWEESILRCIIQGQNISKFGQKCKKNWTYFEKEQRHACNYRTHEIARICPEYLTLTLMTETKRIKKAYWNISLPKPLQELRRKTLKKS